jgi:PAS domain-containing protein
MTRKNNPTDDTVALRKRAEKQARDGAIESPKDLDALSPKQLRQMLHELRVHQIELAMQNDELRRTQTELEASRARYFDLYDLAPVGYCTLSQKGLILEGNLAAAALLGVARSALARTPLSRFIIKEDQDVYYLNRRKLFETGESQSCDLRVKGKDGCGAGHRR